MRASRRRARPGAVIGVKEIAMKCPECKWEIKEGGVKVKTGGNEVVYCCQDCAEKARKKAK